MGSPPAVLVADYLTVGIWAARAFAPGPRPHPCPQLGAPRGRIRERLSMDTHARVVTRWRCGVGLAIALVSSGLGLVASCSSSPVHPAELGADDGAVTFDHAAQHEAAAQDVTSEAEAEAATMPALVTDAGSDADVAAEAACQPAGDGGVTVSPASLSFGDGGQVPCGTQATAQTVTIENGSCAPVMFQATVTSGGGLYTITPSQGMVPPLSQQPLTINPNPIPQKSLVTTDLYEGTLSITTTALGDPGHIVQLHMTAYGVILTSTVGGQTLAFGGVSIGKTGSAQFSVSNNGNADTTVSFAVGSSFFSVSPSFSIPANKSVAPQVTFSPTNVQPYTDAIITTVPLDTPLCAPLPGNTQLTGSGTTGVDVEPTNLDFGLVQCGQPPAAYQTIAIKNTGAAIAYTPNFKLGSNSPYTLADDLSGKPITPGNPIVLGPASSATLRVVPKQIPRPATTAADGYADTLTIVTTGMGDAPHNVSLHETAQGTIFTLSPSNIATSAQTGFSTFANFQVGNSGNLSAGYTLAAATTQGPPDTFSTNLMGGTLGPGTGENGILTCVGPSVVGEASTAQALGTLTLTPAAGTILCADVPPPMPLSITKQ
jgi:hypothetical protein